MPLVLSTSDDNLLKNIELFDKLALRFHGRLLFLKDVLGDEICCWSFYGQGRKIAEVCCTSIVYATEKKQTKVRGGWGGWEGGLGPWTEVDQQIWQRKALWWLLWARVLVHGYVVWEGHLITNEMRLLD